jgi:hypothetical protein
MMTGISDLVTALRTIFPPWVLVAMGAVALVTLGPRWIESMRDKQLRGLVRRMIRADSAERTRLREQILGIAGTRPGRLVAVVLHAIHYDQRHLRDTALRTLEATGAAPADVTRLRARIEKPPTRFRDPIEAAVRIEQLFRDGLVVAATEQLAIARAAFPADPDLQALAAREASSAVAADRAAGGGPAVVE